MQEIKAIAKRLREIFCQEVYQKLKVKKEKIDDRNLDSKVLNLLISLDLSNEEYEIHFQEPKDKICKAQSGRAPYDILCTGRINQKEFLIFINNKFGDLKSNARNDITTYNNLIRLYLGIGTQRLPSRITLNRETICDRVSGKQIVSYGVFVLDKQKRDSNFFLLEEIADNFYVNPRNNMFQVSYKPDIRDEPMSYYDMVVKLIDSIYNSLKKGMNKVQTELTALEYIRNEIEQVNKNS